MIIQANAFKIPLGDESVHCIITSPPYWGLRDYKVKAQIGLEKTPEEYIQQLVEIFREVKRALRKDGTLWLNLGDSYAGSGCGTNDYRTPASISISRPKLYDGPRPQNKVPSGLKPKDLAGIPWRVALALQADGWWLRMDIIWSKPNPMPESVAGSAWVRHRIKIKKQAVRTERTKKGQLCDRQGTFKERYEHGEGIAEWQDCPGCSKCSPNDGYVLRMSAGRPTRSHEYVFLLTKSEKYFFDQEAARELASYDGRKDTFMKGSQKYNQAVVPGQPAHTVALRGHERWPAQLEDGSPARNIRSVWTIPTQPFKGAHFATFPEKLVELCMKAGTSGKGVCPKCGNPWVRILKPSEEYSKLLGKGYHNHSHDIEQGMSQEKKMPRTCADYRTVGWKPTCLCNAGDPVPAVVCDPFCGSGTVGVVAKKLGRKFICIDLKREYCEMAAKRIESVSYQKGLF